MVALLCLVCFAEVQFQNQKYDATNSQISVTLWGAGLTCMLLESHVMCLMINQTQLTF